MFGFGAFGTSSQPIKNQLNQIESITNRQKVQDILARYGLL